MRFADIVRWKLGTVKYSPNLNYIYRSIKLHNAVIKNK